MAPTLKLQYFDFDFWRAEGCRLTMHVGGLEFEDARFGERDEFTALKESGEFPFGSVPVLYITEGGETTTIAQSPSIMRYAGKLTGLYPEDPLEAALVDQIVDGANDCTAKVMAAGKEGGAEVVAEWLGFYEKLLVAKGGSFFNGKSLSIAELTVTTMMGFLGRMAGDMSAVPHVKSMVDATNALPAVAEWNAKASL